ncbi:hypothetical protein B0H13DRAFT_2035225, partial [Mycena leptocephala]
MSPSKTVLSGWSSVGNCMLYTLCLILFLWRRRRASTSAASRLETPTTWKPSKICVVVTTQPALFYVQFTRPALKL